MSATLIFAMAVQGGQPSSNSGIGRHLEQCELAFFNDLAIVEVGELRSRTEQRRVAGSFGSETKNVLLQDVTVLDATFKSQGRLTLVYPCKFLTGAPLRVGAIRDTGTTLPPGRYFVAGRTSASGSVQIAPDMPSLGTEVGTGADSVRVASVAALNGEFGVFSAFETGLRRLPTHDRSPSDVLTTYLSAALTVDASLTRCADLLLRTNQLGATAIVNSAPLATAARLEAQGRQGVPRALLLAVAFKSGDGMAEADMLAALDQSDRGADSFWQTQGGAELLTAIRAGTQPRTPEFEAWRRNSDRQVMIAGYLANANSDSLRSFLLARMTNKYDPQMAPALRSAVNRATPQDASCEALLQRLSDWFSEPGHGAPPRDAGDSVARRAEKLGAELEFWRERLRRQTALRSS